VDDLQTQRASAMTPLPEGGFAARRASPLARSLALGFGGALAMWALAYFAMMTPGLIVGEALFVLTLACVFVTGLVAGRHRQAGESGAMAAMKAAFVTATLNMLLIGSLAGGHTPRDKMMQLLLWTVGNYVVSLALGALGGALASTRQSHGQSQRNWFSVFTRIAAATVLLLLITGGLVTGLEAGLAVPDWPTSYGHNMLLYPLSEMIGGRFFEHAHRLYGMLVGVTAITLAISAFWLDNRRWLRALAVVYLLIVCTQGYLGGARVHLINTGLAVMHGVFGQVVFATVCAIAACTSPIWISGIQSSSRPSAKTDRTWTVVLVLALLLQLALGAMYRHMLHKHVLYTHILWAVFVAALAIFTGVRAASRYADLPVLPRLGKATMHTVGLQIALGIVALIAVLARPSATPPTAEQATPIAEIPLWEITFTTAHQATGALLLGLATMLMLWTRRLLRP
jgi:cytochrome c oxidase assembly protein subunit 15